jgi:hypothetical protein
MTIRFAAILAVLLAASPLAAQGLDGNYSTGPQACGDPGNDGAMAIRGSRIEFWESRCELRDPTAIRDMPSATLFDLVCSGEGETWTYRALLMPSSEGLVLLREGFATVYARCP